MEQGTASLELSHYVRAKQIHLAQSIAGRQKIYLDLNFWITLRETAAGRRTGAAEQELLRLLREGVAAGRFVCPIGDSFFFELFKQPFSEDRRVGTARLVDALSLGVSITNSRIRIGTEIYSYFLSAVGVTNLYPMQELIWTKLCYVLGETHPSLPGFDPAFVLQLQKGFVDRMWEVSLAEVILTIGDNTPDKQSVGLGAETNRQRDLHADEITSFERAYEIEVAGGIDACGDLAAEAMCSWAERNNIQPPEPGSPAWLETERTMQNILAASLVKGVGRKPMRTLHIEALLHAAMRWDKPRRFKDNDFSDFRHAAAAVGYCDAFFTERPLAEMLSWPRLEVSDINGCRISSSVEGAIAILEPWLANAAPASG